MVLPIRIIKQIMDKPNTCPYCNLTTLDADQPTLGEHDDILVHVTCTSCHHEWVEVYEVMTVISVEDVDIERIPPNCEFVDESCKSIDYRSVSGNRADDYANIPCEHYEECKRRAMKLPIHRSEDNAQPKN